MKVFINFNDVRCCVPVGDGSLTVKQVILLAIERYKKATSKDSNWHIIVHTLKTIRDGAILDPDDSLFDVADDREQLIAVFDEHHNNNNDNNYGNDRNAAVADAANLNKGPQLPSNNSNMSAKLANNHRNYMNIAQSNYHHHHHHHNKSNSLHSYDPRQHQQHQPNLNENVYGRVKKIPQQQQQQVLHPHPIPPLSSITPGKRNTNPFSINQPPYQQQHQHFHSGSMSDSLISGSNDSPSISLIHHSNSYHEQRNPIQQPNRVSIEVMDTRQTSIAIHNAARRSLPYHHEDGLPSSIYEPKFNHSSITTTNAYTSDMESSNEFGDDSLEITVDDINSHTNIPLSLHVRHGSEPNISHNDVGRNRITSEHHDNNEQNNQNLIVIDNDQSISDIDVGGGARVANIINQYKSNDLDLMQAKHNTNNNSNQKHQRWSTAIAIEQNNGSSRLIDATNKKSQLVSNYEHSDEEKSFNSISPQSTKEEGYGSEEQSQNSQSESIIITPHPTSPTIPDGGGGLSSPQMFNHVTQTFARGSGRLSMLNNNLDQWADAADRQLIKIRQNNQQQQPEQEKSLTTGSTTTSAAAASTTTATTTNSLKPPNSYLQTQTIDKNFHRPNHHQQLTLCDSSLGSMSNSSQENEHHSIANLPAATRAGRFYSNQPKKSNLLSVIIDLSKERGGPLGIHILSDNGPNLNQGLLIHGIEPGGRIDRDGRLNVGDIIVELDDKSFAGIQYEKAQEIFRSSLDNDCIKLLIQKSSLNYCDNSPNLNVNVNNSNNEQEDEENKENQQLVEGVEERIVAGQLAKMAQVTPTKKLPSPGVSNLIGYKPATSAIVIANTRRIGKKYHIQLKKEEHGLGFTITTRDNPAGGLSPIYIKTILPRGAAVQDGRLKPGDRLLEVCGIEMTGKSQEEAVKILRNLPSDSIVDLIVSRQEVEVSPSPLMPRQLPPEATNEPNCSSNKEREVLTFQILLNDTGSAGLGISVKGKTSNADGQQQDSGIFIKSVLHGGAASKDGRLKQDDQLININGIPLSGKTNSEAMETLTRATIKSAHQITLTIARRTCHSPSHRNDDNDDNNNMPYRHQQEMSILSTDSYDMSFTTNNNSNNHNNTTNGNNQSNDGQNRLYNDSQYSHEDSFRSSENTVIYNVSQKQNFINTAVNESKNSIMDNHRSMVNKFSTNDSQSSSSLNDDQQLQLQQRKQSIDVGGGGGGGGGGGVVDDGDRFRRDGFGRQSMSEKRHAQLDAKTTDTYRRSKKNKDHQPHQQQTTGNNQNDNNGDDGGNVGDDERIESNRIDTTTVVRYGEDGNQNGNLHHNDHHRPAYDRDNVELKTPATIRGGSVLTSDKKVKSSQTKNQILFSPVCCWKCQSPGSCPCRSKSELSAEIYNSRMNGYPVDNKMIMMKQQHQKQGSNSASSKAEAVLMPPPPFIIRKSCSLESLQTMMQDLQKEQLEQVGGSNVHGDDSGYHTARHATTIARIGKSVPNESFRAAVDRSYNFKTSLPHSSQIQSVTEEGDDETTTASRTSTCPYRVGGGHSMTSTNYTIETTTATTTTNADDNARLLKTNSKKKKNFIKTLFHFGSRKGRSKSMEPGSHKKSDDLRLQSSNEMKMFPKDYDDNLKYRLEQERIRYQYDKLIEEEKHKKQQQQQQPEYQQQQQFVRNPSHPMHQSMPLSNSHRSRAGISPRNQTTNSTTNTNRLQQQQQQVYMSNYTPSPRDTVGVPQVMRNEKSNLRPHHHQHRVHPETTSDDYSNRFGDLKNQIHPPVESGNARHLQINSHDFYGRITSSNRPENQPVLEANINHSNYGVPYSNANNNANKMFGNNTQRHYGTASRTMVTNLDQAEKNIHHYRQLSLRQPQQQHQRQISSPATGQNFYQFQQRSVLNYYGEQQKSPPSGTATNIVPRNYTTNHLNQTRSYQTTPTTNQYGPSIQQQKNETIYGIVGQQHQSQQQQMRTNHNHHQQQQQTILGPNVMFRQQQPIYQTNQLQIYGTVYNNNNNNPNMNSGNSNNTVNNPHHHHQTSGHYDLKPHSNHSQNGLPYAYSSIVGSNQ